jgi:hypothetical protein
MPKLSVADGNQGVIYRVSTALPIGSSHTLTWRLGSKTDQEGRGQEIAISRGYRLRPVEAVQAWLAAAEINSGPVFRQRRKTDECKTRHCRRRMRR